MSFDEYALNKHNYEFLKEFNRLNNNDHSVHLINKETGDLIELNKRFLMDMIDQDNENDLENKNSYRFLSEGSDFELD